MTREEWAKLDQKARRLALTMAVRAVRMGMADDPVVFVATARMEMDAIGHATEAEKADAERWVREEWKP